MTALPKKIKQWVTGQDGLDKLRIEEVDLPSPGQDEVLVEVHAVSLNYRDTEGLFGLPWDAMLKCTDQRGSCHGPLQPPQIGFASTSNSSLF